MYDYYKEKMCLRVRFCVYYVCSLSVQDHDDDTDDDSDEKDELRTLNTQLASAQIGSRKEKGVYVCVYKCV